MAAKAFVPPDNGAGWWRDIPGYGGKYRANRAGDVQRVFPSGLVRDMTPYRKKERQEIKKQAVCKTDGGRKGEGSRGAENYG